MSWYDYVPLVGSGIEAYKGNWGDAGLDLFPGYRAAADIGGALYQKLYKGPADEKKKALDEASAQANALGQDARAYQEKGLNQALGMYAPANAAYKALYGDPSQWTK